MLSKPVMVETQNITEREKPRIEDISSTFEPSYLAFRVSTHQRVYFNFTLSLLLPGEPDCVLSHTSLKDWGLECLLIVQICGTNNEGLLT